VRVGITAYVLPAKTFWKRLALLRVLYVYTCVKTVMTLSLCKDALIHEHDELDGHR
jgi:hypothetical protein